MRRSGRWNLVIPSLVMTLVLSGCRNSPVAECDPCFTSAIIRGSVTDPTGQPQSRIPVSVTTYRSDCGIVWRATSEFRTDSLGQFRRRIQSPFSPHVAECVQIMTGSAPEWPVDTLEIRSGLEFRFDSNEAHLDSITVNVVTGG